MRRSIVWRAALVAAFNAVVLPGTAQTGRPSPVGAGDPRTLSQDAPVIRELSVGQSHAYRLPLKAGEFVFITIEQQGIDVAAMLVDPNGRNVVSVDVFDDPFRQETMAAAAEADGNFTVVVRPAPNAVPKGRYVIRLEESRPRVPSDDARVVAERAFASALRNRSRDRAETLTSALAELNAALDTYRRLADRRGEMKTLIETGATEYYLLRPEALASAEQAESMARELGDGPAVARTLRLLGNVLIWRGNYHGAAAKLEEANAISRTIGDQRGMAVSLNATGRVYWRTGELEKAISAFERALLLARATNNHAQEAQLLGNMGLVYKLLGMHDRALSMYEQSLANSREQNDVRGQTIDLVNLGNLERLRGDYPAALKRHAESLALSRRAGLEALEATSLGAMGLTYYELGEYAKALEHHDYSIAIRRRIDDVSGQAVALSGRGLDLHALGRSEEGIAALQEARAIFRDLRQQSAESDTLHELAAVERDRGNLTAALNYVESAVELSETLRQRITSPELRAAFASARLDSYELFVDLLQRQHAADPAGGHAIAALQVNERARARVLLESLLEARVDLREGVEPALLQRERALQTELSDISARFSGALTRSAHEERTSAARQLKRATEEYQNVQREIRQRSPRYAALTQPEPLTVAEIQREVLDDDTVLLEFALGEERSWLWAVTPQMVTSVELPSRRELEGAARALYAELTARQPRDGEAAAAYARRVAAADRRLEDRAAAVSRMLFNGLAEQFNGPWRGKRLAIVAAGALQYLPFAALPIPQADNRSAAVQRAVPLVAQHEIVEAPSASVLATLRREARGRKPAPRAVAVLADPVFDAADPRVARTSRRAPNGPSASRAVAPSVMTDNGWHLSRAVQRISEVRGGSGLTRLPFSREEADVIASFAGQDESLKATDFKANREAVLGRALEDYRIVHFATHGLIDSERPELSGLILSLVGEGGSLQNGFVRLHDIFNMRLNADLVVLSACQTALGKQIRGEGFVGLTRGFMYAGAPRVVASLWQVSDLATAELMKAFYAGMLQRQLPAAAALRAAQLDLAKNPRWSSPYFWAGFVLQGDWQ